MIWSILGMSVALVAVFCITVAETLVGKPIFEAYRPHIAIVLGVFGAVLWFIGRSLASRRGDARLFLLFDLRYWGPVLLAFGVITLFIRPLREVKSSKPILATQSKPRPKPAPPVVVQKPEEPQVEPSKPAVFPALKMQGVIYKESKPVAIINGQTYAVGDHLGEVVVRAIQRDSVMLELGGELKVLTVN